MEAQQVKDYLNLLPNSVTAPYSSMVAAEQDKQIFLATELLSDFYREVDLTPRTVALQILFNLEAEGEEYARLKRHGVQSFSTKGTSVTFARVDSLSPAVIDILGEPKKVKGSIGRLI
jgi:hypothetical protein